MISPVSDRDKPVSLNLQHGSPWLYQTIHFPAPFSSRSHTISPLYFYLFLLPGPYVKWKDRSEYSPALGNFSQRTYNVKSLSITVIPSYPDKTKTVVWLALILLRCQLCYLKYSNRSRWDFPIYLSVIIFCLSIHTKTTCVWNTEQWKVSQVVWMIEIFFQFSPMKTTITLKFTFTMNTLSWKMSNPTINMSLTGIEIGFDCKLP